MGSDQDSAEKESVEHVEALPHAVSNAERFGYKQELPVGLSMLSVMGLSFAIIMAPNVNLVTNEDARLNLNKSLSVTMYFGLVNGGPVTILYGWIFILWISLSIAASLGELSSVYPTLGGLYFWAVKTAPQGYGPIVGYITGWLNLTGNWLILLSINFSGAQLIMSIPTLFYPDYIATAWQVWLCFVGVMCICGLINLSKNHILDKLNAAVLYWTGAGVIIILVTVLVMAKGGRRPASFVFGGFENRSGYPSGWSWFVGLLQPGYVMTGYGMIAAMAEETSKPETEVAKAMVLSVFAAGITGIVFLIPILFVLPDIAPLLSIATGQPMPEILRSATGSAAGSAGLLALIIGMMFFSGTGAVTAGARTCFAFSRDGAIPGSKHWSRISPRFEQPVNALILTIAINSAIGLIYLGSAAAFSAFTGCGTMALSAAYCTPILMNVLSGRKHTRGAYFSLGRLGWFINITCLVWLPLACIIYSSPTALPVTAKTANYASVIFVAFMLFAYSWYLYWGRFHFKGPAVRTLILREWRWICSLTALPPFAAQVSKT